MSSNIQKQMMASAIPIIRGSIDNFRADVMRSPFTYATDVYEDYFVKVEAALTYVESAKAYQPDDKILKGHQTCLRAGFQDVIHQLQMEAAANVLPDDA